MWHFADLLFSDQIFLWFADLPQVRKYMLFLLTNNALIKIWGSVVQFLAEICGFSICGLIIQICGFAICGLTHQRNLGICDIRMTPRIYGFAICSLKFACSLLHISSCAFMHFSALYLGSRQPYTKSRCFTSHVYKLSQCDPIFG